MNILRLAVVTDSFVLPAWQVFLLEQLTTLPEAALVAAVKLDPSSPSRPDTGIKHTLWRAYAGLEDRFLKSKHDPLELRDERGFLESLSVVIVKGEALTPENLAELAALNLDIVLQLGAADLSEGLKDVAAHVWRYSRADALAARGSAGGARELLTGEGTTSSSLLDALTGKTLYSSAAPTHYLSVAQNRNYLWKTALFARRAVKALAQGTLGAVETASATSAEPPGNLEMLGLTLKHAGNYLKLRLNMGLSPEQWILLYKRSERLSTDLSSFEQLIPPADRFWADPFVIGRNGKHYIFLEELFYSDYTGHISVITVEKDGTVSEPVTVIKQPYHMSYPLLVEYGGELYMLPETSANKTLDVYRCTDFPHGWTHHKTLMQDVSAFDATPYYDGHRWWLFVNMKAHEGISDWDELYLFHAESPLSDNWTPHPQNPVVSSVASSRPAGHLFTRDGELYRPSQDSSNGYGYGLKLNRVLTLSETQYKEETVKTLTPWDKSIAATHTLNYAGGLTVADARRRRR